jgi:hypothetical protein
MKAIFYFVYQIDIEDTDKFLSLRLDINLLIADETEQLVNFAFYFIPSNLKAFIVEIVLLFILFFKDLF